MEAIEKIEAAIKRLLQVKSTLGFVMVGEDPTDLYVRVEEDDDGDGNTFAYGLSVGGGVDSDEEINEALVLVAGTIDAQLAILRSGLEWLHEFVLPAPTYADGRPMSATRIFKVTSQGRATLALADAILGDA